MSRRSATDPAVRGNRTAKHYEESPAKIFDDRTGPARQLASLERFARIFALIVIPLLIAWLGWQQSQATNRQLEANAKLASAVSSEGSRLTADVASQGVEAAYVAIAVDVLSVAPDPGMSDAQVSADQKLRSWAVELLSESSPVAIPSDLREAFENGDVTLCDQLSERIDYAENQLSDEISGTGESGNAGAGPEVARIKFEVEQLRQELAKIRAAQRC